LRQTSSVLYIAVDGLIPARGKSIAGLDEFTAALDHAGIPAVWVTSRSRLQFDEARRKLAHANPFISEGGCCVCMPEGYFHLKPETTVRLGRFTCIPVAQALPAAAQALESLSSETGVAVVSLASLSPRELAQNTGLPQREAELMRQRDFDEVFFFAGASEKDIQRFGAEARERKLQLRQHGMLWSLASGANLKRCIQDSTKLYDRALRYHAAVVGVATSEGAAELFAACDRSILLTETREETDAPAASSGARTRQFPLRNRETWDHLLESVSGKSW